MRQFKHILIIQTAYIGDAILATAVAEKLHQTHPDATIDWVVRKGLKNILETAPYVDRILEWDKAKGKYKSLFKIISKVRAKHYDLTVNLHRFASSGLIAAFARSEIKSGFSKNPLAFTYTHKFLHQIGDGTHEIDRNQSCITPFTDPISAKPKIYFSEADKQKVDTYQQQPYITLAPTSVWFTKQFPADQWIDFLRKMSFKGTVYLLGAPGDKAQCDHILKASEHDNIHNLCGMLSLRESALLMKGAVMNFVNDSAPMHLASAVDGPTAAIFCSTVPSFGFGPLATNSQIIETSENLKCRPCGLHGFKSCPQGHFNCAKTISSAQLIDTLKS